MMQVVLNEEKTMKKIQKSTILEHIECIKKLIKSKTNEQLQLKKTVGIIIFIWTIIIAISIYVSAEHENIKIKTVAENTARAGYLKDQAFRLWASSHGGVYVPVTKKTTPNKFLANLPYRDIEKPDGTKLTLMNPAYMLRQMMQEYSGIYGLKGRITSLKYVYEGNKPDEWEIKALKSFEKGKKELLEYTEMQNKPFLRLMRPMYTKKSCLKCHSGHGYNKVGDVSGGVGVLLPLEELYEISKHHFNVILIAHLGIWLFVFTGIIFFTIKKSISLEEKSEIEKSLKENALLLKESQRIAHIGSWKYDIEADILICSNEAYNIIEADKDKKSFSFQEYLNIIHPEDRTMVKQSYYASLKNKAQYNTVYRLLMKDGRIKFVNDLYETDFNQDGKALISIGTVQDITEQKNLENKLLSSQKLFETFMHYVPVNILIKDNDGRIIYANDSIKTFFGTDNLYGKKAEDLFSEDDVISINSFNNRILKEGVHEEIKEVVNYKKEKCLLRIMGFTMLHNHMKEVGIIAIDITQSYKDKEKIKEQEELMIAQSHDAAMGEMINMIAHQWRQPISVISIQANNILADIELETLSEETLCLTAKDIVAQTQELSKTIDDFRNFFKQDREKENALISDIFMESFAIINKCITNNEIEIENIFDTNTKIWIYSRELLQVFINILKNAQEALKENRNDERKITNRIYETDTSIIVEISDNGGGISNEIIDKIFQPYYSTKKDQNGTGLGLYLSKTIIEKHFNGKLSVKNVTDIQGANIGTCFIIELQKERRKNV
jgi:PAS domain S-box-containing protein